MKLSMHTDKLERRFGAIATVRMIAAAGFEAIDYSMYYSDLAVFGRGGRVLASELKRVAEGYGLSFNQAHAPFSDFGIGDDSAAKNRAIYDSMCESIAIAARLGAPTIIIHPALICPRLPREERLMMNVELFSKLSAVADSFGIGISIENTFARHPDKNEKIVKGVCSDAEELIRYADELSRFGIDVCFDSGHAGLVGEVAAGMVRALGPRIKRLHLHDNDFNTDSHTLPYLASVNFASLTKALGRIGYTGDVTLESDGFIKNMPDDLVPAALLFSRSVASHIRDEIIRFS
ncbi:MAG: sugar phosphate isomerase/epimerase [Clostridia bacterium]|nr:sugar phosphate isomerase/epimerase [Clostridia bacterium]